MFQARAAPSQGNESEIRTVLTQKTLVIYSAESKPGSSVARPNRICTIFRGNCHGPTESSSRRIRNTLILSRGVCHNRPGHASEGQLLVIAQGCQRRQRRSAQIEPSARCFPHKPVVMRLGSIILTMGRHRLLANRKRMFFSQGGAKHDSKKETKTISCLPGIRHPFISSEQLRTELLPQSLSGRERQTHPIPG